VLARVDFSSGWPPTKNFGLNLILVDGDAKIRPGMSAVARIAVERVPDVLLVPAESVFPARRRAGRLPPRRLRVRGTPSQIQRRGRNSRSSRPASRRRPHRAAPPPAEMIRRTD
jgi:multidrug efflux pump subunit AcrA (membrane-fusion protein)